MSEDIFEMFMHKNHGDFQKLSVIVKDSKSQVQNDKVLLLPSSWFSGLFPVQSCTICTYILKAGFAGFQKPQKILNFLQKDYLRTRKLSILQCVLEIKPKLLPTFLPKITNYHRLLPIITKIIDLRTYVGKFYCRDLRTFSADLLRLKIRLRRFLRF